MGSSGEVTSCLWSEWIESWGIVHTYIGDLLVYRRDRVEQGGGLRKYHGAPHHGGRPEDPEEHPVQHHRHYAPVLILLQ